MTSPAVIPAASVLLARGRGSPEVYLVHRSPSLSFFGDFWAFPGGKVSASDKESSITAEDPGLACLRLAAARELFEETGVLLTRRADDAFPPHSAELELLRRHLLEGARTFPQVLHDLNVTVHAEDFRVLGEVTTPAFVRQRYATTFFVALIPPGQQPVIWPGELTEGRWSSAAAMLAAWTRGECLLSPPTVMTLQAIRDRPADEAPQRLAPLLASLAAGRLHPIFFAPAVQLVPLRTVALPPATHTNAFLLGNGPVYLLDPGPNDPAEQQRLFELLEEQGRAGRRLTAIVLTHHHPDHIGAAAACAARYGVPVWAHPATAEKLPGQIPIARLLHDGDRLDLGPCPDDGGTWFLQALHTPGHAPGHLAFYEPHYRLLFAGDMVSTVTSILIPPRPEGDLAVYLQSLDRLHAVDCRLLLPSHGNVSAQPRATIAACLEHRARREDQLLRALHVGPRTIADLAPELYQGLAEKLRPFARWQILAGLQKLQNEGRVETLAASAEGPWRLLGVARVEEG